MAQKTIIKASDVKTRDHLMVRLINGATKSGVQKDRKKEDSRKQCRKRVRDGEDS